MSVKKRGRRYWATFSVDGVLFRKPLGTTKYNEALQKERDLIQEAKKGALNAHERGPKRLFEAIDAYINANRMFVRERTTALDLERLTVVKRHFGDIRLTAVTPKAIGDFQCARLALGRANRTVNMDVAVLSRVLKFAKKWERLREQVKFLPEPPSDIGRALTHEEQARLMETAASNPAWEHVYHAAVLAANTSMRRVEVRHLRRRDVDVINRTVRVAKSKNATSHRVLPLNDSALRSVVRMLDRLGAQGFTDPDHYLWYACQWNEFDPTKPMEKWDTAWHALREKAGLPTLRFHDLRHTAITRLAERGVPDQVLKSIAGHLSQRMLEHYSHIRLNAKREALDLLDASPDARYNDAEVETKSTTGSQSDTVQ